MIIRLFHISSIFYSKGSIVSDEAATARSSASIWLVHSHHGFVTARLTAHPIMLCLRLQRLPKLGSNCCHGFRNTKDIALHVAVSHDGLTLKHLRPRLSQSVALLRPIDVLRYALLAWV